jgi:hypothetical protein
MVKVPITAEQLNDHLNEQLTFLQRSAESYDAGYESEAKRMAVTIRLLLHDTTRSKSLLGQLKKRDILFNDTALKNEANNQIPFAGLVFQTFHGGRAKYVAMLDDVPSKVPCPFDAWWNGAAFADEKNNQTSRKDLVLVAANQDGGVHVDPSLDATYHQLKNGNSLGWAVMANGRLQPMGDPTKAAIRQVAHEVLSTLVPGYEKQPPAYEMLFGGMAVITVDEKK